MNNWTFLMSNKNFGNASSICYKLNLLDKENDQIMYIESYRE